MQSSDSLKRKKNRDLIMEITALKILLTLFAKLFFLQLFVLDKNAIKPRMI